MTQVICNKASSCKEAPMCGGAQPHEHSDCERCPFDNEAECAPVESRPVDRVVMAGDTKCLVCRKCGASSVRDDDACYRCGSTWFNVKKCATSGQCEKHGCLDNPWP